MSGHVYQLRKKRHRRAKSTRAHLDVFKARIPVEVHVGQNDSAPRIRRVLQPHEQTHVASQQAALNALQIVARKGFCFRNDCCWCIIITIVVVDFAVLTVCISTKITSSLLTSLLYDSFVRRVSCFLYTYWNCATGVICNIFYRLSFLAVNNTCARRPLPSTLSASYVAAMADLFLEVGLALWMANRGVWHKIIEIDVWRRHVS